MKNDDTSVPELFHILAGWFYKNDCEMLKHEGIFRVTGVHKEIRLLELHLSQGHYDYLN